MTFEQLKIFWKPRTSEALHTQPNDWVSLVRRQRFHQEAQSK